MNTSTLALRLPSPFNLYTTLTSHGWLELLPNSYDTHRSTLQRIERLSTGQVVQLEVNDMGMDSDQQVLIHVFHQEVLSQAEKDEIMGKIGHMLRLDEDFSEFYALCLSRGGRWERLATGMGRILRSPTVFEDVVKTICTTNVQWGGTKGMIRRLVGAYGEPYPVDAEKRSFPLPGTIACNSLESFADTVRMGYRAPYIHLLAQQVSTGALDLQAMLDPAVPTPELRRKLLSIKGVGAYAAATLLMLLGHYDELAIDSAYRQVVGRLYFDGKYPSDKESLLVYQEWGQWKYLAYWFDIWELFHS